MKYKITILLIFLNFFAFSQEYTVIGGYAEAPKTTHKKAVEEVNLPFFDDFSNYETFSQNFPFTNATIDNYASVMPPTVGAAMFDAVDNYGDYYASHYNQSVMADQLTSASINLNFPNDETIFMSFYYQPKGILDLPEKKDSLVLQFYAPNQKQWKVVWSAPTPQNDQEFKQVILNIGDSCYLQNGFKFRFYNKISMPNNEYPSLVTNCDQWFVDYIYINRNRSENDTIRRDVAFQYPLQFKINEYQKIPYAHYRQNVNKNIFNYNFYLNYRNNDIGIRGIDSLYTVVEQPDNLVANDTIFMGAKQFPGLSNFYDKVENLDFSFPIIENTDEINLQLKTKLITNAYDSVCNNEMIVPKKLSTIYAYDDGTSENGYGLLGTGTLYANVAQKFTTYSSDYMTGISIYLNKTFKEVQPYYFYVKIWNEDPATSMPGTLIYEQEGLEIDHEKLGQFQNLIFDEPVEISNNFFVGWTKTYDHIMNVGVDLNFRGDNYKYYNISGAWKQSNIDGVLMIRPIFGNPDLADVAENSAAEINIYPNPTSDIVNITTKNSDNKVKKIIIRDFVGRIIVEKQNSEATISLDVRDLATGIYFVDIFVGNNKITKKIVKI